VAWTTVSSTSAHHEKGIIGAALFARGTAFLLA
jgi:hypothetical protein